MWMQYSDQRYTPAANIKPWVENLSWKLDDLIRDALVSVNYDINICFDPEEVQRVREASMAYRIGVILCGRYCSGDLDLDEFCEHMDRVKLKHFLCEILNLPEYIINKYQLKQFYVEDSSSNVDT